MCSDAGIKINFLDRLIEEIHSEREHNELVLKVNIPKAYVKDIEECLHIINIS